MYNPLFITATNTDVGKTYSIIKLIQAISKYGIRVGVYKPIETGVVDMPLDGLSLYNEVCKYNKSFTKLSINDVVSYKFKLPASVYVAKDKAIDINYIKSHIEYLHNYCDILLIEGAGGLMVPIDIDFFMVDLIQKLEAKALLITNDKLGCINDTLLSIEKLKSKNIDFEWVVNVQNYANFYTITNPFYEKFFKNVHILQDDLDKLVRQFILCE